MSETPRAESAVTPDGGTDLLDTLGRPVRDLRISVTDRCNFRCPYCMPAEIYGDRYRFMPKPEILSFEEVERLTRIFAGLGVRKLRLTGGEPLVRHQLPKLVEQLAAIPGVDDLALTTNGYLLEGQAQALRDAGLRRVTISLDSLDEDVFRRMNGRHYGTERVLAGIEAADRAGLRPIKINCVVQKGVNDHTLVDLARYFKGTGAVVRFIEYMDVGTRNEWSYEQVVPSEELVARIHAEMPLEPVGRSYRGEVANRWRYTDGGGEIGVVTSVTAPFCRDCTRARLTPNGRLVTCLFASGGTDLKTPLRAGATDTELRDLIASVWTRRADRYSEQRAEAARTGRPLDRPKLEMYELGG